MPILDTFKRLKRIPAGFILGRLNGAKGKTGDAELIPIDDFLDVIGATLSASNVEFTPYDHITSTNVQDALEEIIDEFVSKVKTATQTMVSSLTIDPGTGSAAILSLLGDGVNPLFFAQAFFADVNSPGLICRKGRGTEAAPAVVILNDRCVSVVGQARSNISTNISMFNMFARVIAATPSSTDMQSQMTYDLIPAGTATLSSSLGVTSFTLDHTNGLALFGSSTVIDPDRVFRLRSFATGSLPANVTGKLTYDSTIGRPVWNDGTAWRRVPRAFTELSDVPTSYSGQALEIVRVNAGETALEFTPLTAAIVTFDDTSTTIVADDVQEAIEALDAASGGGGVIVQGAYFSGSTGSIDTASTAAFATKGIIFTPDVDMTINAVIGFIDAAATSEAHHAQIASLDGNTTAALVVASLGTSATVSSPTTNMRPYRFVFASPVALTAGTSYLIAVVNASNLGTTACRVGATAALSNNGWHLNAPGKTEYVTMSYNTINAAATDAADASNADAYFCITMEGTTDE